MIHYEYVLPAAKNVIETMWKAEKKAKAYIIQNVYGKIAVYLHTENSSLRDNIYCELQKEIGEWLSSCELLKDNYFAESEAKKWEQDYKPVSDRIWIIEKFLTNVYWNGEQKKQNKNKLNSKSISFYSFKGGVGRTTTMVMSAIELAKRGKKVVLLDFDMEAPGIASLFPDESISQYGVLDFLIESAVYGENINIDGYMYTVSEYCHVTQDGGEIYVVPALGQICRKNVELYRKNLMRFDLNLPAYGEETTPIDTLLMKIDSFLRPDFILIDTRSGLHQIGGITLTRYSDIAVLFFYGSQQNIEGMQMVLPVLKSSGTPFTLINCKMPANEGMASIEKKIYLEGAYRSMALCDERYKEGSIALDDTTADHYPVDIHYSDTLEVIDSTEQLLKAFEEQRGNYRELVNILENNLVDDREVEETSKADADSQNEMLIAFSSIINGLETPAAEDEFMSDESLKVNFYPLKGYTFIFDTRKFLILGQKGVGKTALFNALKNNEYAKALAKYLRVDLKQYAHTEWIVGTEQNTDWKSLFGCLITEEQVSAFLLYKTIEKIFENDPSLEDILEESTVRDLFGQELSIEICHSWTRETVYYLEHLMYSINNRLKGESRFITIIYDALDRVVMLKDRAKLSSALIEMWYRYENTMENIRSKIFLRKDIYDREVNVADKVKLKNYSVTLMWEYDQLFAMVWKRAAGRSPAVKKFYESVTEQKLLETEGLGYIPAVNEDINKALLAALIGTKMGSDKKAFTYNWFKNRLSDTQGVIVPRSMLDIFARAAEKEKELRCNTQQNIAKNIIRPKCLEDSLEAVSENRVTDLKEEYKEYDVFLSRLKDTVQRSPVEEADLKKALENAGFQNTNDEIANLINIGIIKKYQRRLSDPVRYHFPDVYLRGLGLQRSGMR